MKRLILGLDTTFSKGTGANKIDRLWEFVDSSYVFADTTNPFPFKDSIEFTNLTSNKNNQTFIGIKLGDVNYDWDNTIAKIKPIELMANSEWQIANNNVTIKQQKINIKIQTPNNVSTSAFQATLHFDNTKYQLIEIRNNKLEIEYNAIKTGQINLLWVSKDGEPKALNANDILFEFILQPINKAETSTPKLEIENSFAVDENINEREIVLKQNNIQSPSPSTQQWLSIYPTLVHQDATITIASTTNKTITLNVYDIAGKLVDTKNIQVLIGNNTYNYNCSKLQKGNYFISSSNKNEQMKTEKFCKQ
jgi:Secretion system C-terminal sorting domain